MRLLVPLVLLAAAAAGGCAFPGHVAEATLERSVPAAGIAVLDCRTHNGDIVLRARPGADTLQVHAALSVRGHTPEAAAANLSHLRVEPRLEGDRLVLAGEYDSEVRSLSPS